MDYHKTPGEHDDDDYAINTYVIYDVYAEVEDAVLFTSCYVYFYDDISVLDDHFIALANEGWDQDPARYVPSLSTATVTYVIITGPS